MKKVLLLIIGLLLTVTIVIGGFAMIRAVLWALNIA